MTYPQHKKPHEEQPSSVHSGIGICNGTASPFNQHSSQTSEKANTPSLGSTAGEIAAAEPQVIRKTVWLRRYIDIPTLSTATLWSAYEDGHECAGIGIPVPLISSDGGKTWTLDDAAIQQAANEVREHEETFEELNRVIYKHGVKVIYKHGGKVIYTYADAFENLIDAAALDAAKEAKP